MGSALSKIPRNPAKSKDVCFALLLAEQIDNKRDLFSLALCSKSHWIALSPLLSYEITFILTRYDEISTVSFGQYRHCDRSGYHDLVKKLGFTADESGILKSKCLPALRNFPNLRELNIDLPYKLFSQSFLSGIRVQNRAHNLRKLSTTLRAPEDVVPLALAIGNLPLLECFTLVSIPDDDSWMHSQIPILGEYLKRCSRSLRHLDISLLNPNRPASWDTDAFVMPDPVDYHFDSFFPTPSEQQRIRAKAELIWDKSYGPEYWNPVFDLESLRLKNFYLPEDAFSSFFNPRTLRKLSIPGCTVHVTVWKDLTKSAQLTGLFDLDHGPQRRLLNEFLLSQNSLEALTFQDPKPVYEYIQAHLDGNDSFWLLEEQMPRPLRLLKMKTFAEQVLAKSGLLEHLRIPPSMFRITEDAIVALFANVHRLKHLEISLDIHDSSLLTTFAGCLYRLGYDIPRITILRSDPDAKSCSLVNKKLQSLPGLKYIRYCDPCSTKYRMRRIYYHFPAEDDAWQWLLLQKSSNSQNAWGYNNADEDVPDNGPLADAFDDGLQDNEDEDRPAQSDGSVDGGATNRSTINGKTTDRDTQPSTVSNHYWVSESIYQTNQGDEEILEAEEYAIQVDDPDVMFEQSLTPWLVGDAMNRLWASKPKVPKRSRLRRWF